MARPAGLEPATPNLEGWCSIQLSYGRGKRRVFYTITSISLICHQDKLTKRRISPGSKRPDVAPGTALHCRLEWLRKKSRGPSRCSSWQTRRPFPDRCGCTRFDSQPRYRCRQPLKPTPTFNSAIAHLYRQDKSFKRSRKSSGTIQGSTITSPVDANTRVSKQTGICSKSSYAFGSLHVRAKQGIWRGITMR